MAVIGWVDTETISDQEWHDMPDEATVLAAYLNEAHEQCLAFLPQVRDENDDLVPDVPDPVPARFRRAQIMQAAALARAGYTGRDDQVGVDGMTVTVFPMDWTVKNLLRPRRVGRVL